MNRFTIRLIVAFLTFVIGIAAASLWFMLHESPTVTIKPAEKFSPTAAPTQPERTYEMGITGRGIPKNGASTAFSDWHTSDGMSFYRWSEYYDSPERANRALQKVLKKAGKIIKRESLFDAAGLKIGEKVIATFPPKNPKYGAATLLWTYGSTFRYVSGSSLENILAYEKDFNGQLR